MPMSIQLINSATELELAVRKRLRDYNNDPRFAYVRRQEGPSYELARMSVSQLEGFCLAQVTFQPGNGQTSFSSAVFYYPDSAAYSKDTNIKLPLGSYREGIYVTDVMVGGKVKEVTTPSLRKALELMNQNFEVFARRFGRSA